MANMTCLLSDSIRQAMTAINLNARRALFVVDADNQFKGVLTDGDIRRALLASCSLDTAVEELVDHSHPTFQHIVRLYDRPEQEAGNIQPYVTARVDTPEEELNLLCLKKNVKIIPLLDEHSKIADFYEYERSPTIPISSPCLQGNELKYVTECIETNWISSQGKYVTQFGQEFAAYCGMSYGIPTTSCTTALHLALLAAGVGPGDEVICPTLTFIAPANMIRLCGARAILVESEEETWNCDPIAVERLITDKTKAIIIVHTFGHAAKMDELLAVARRHNLIVIEDAAEAPGARYKDRPIGSMGDLSCFSFFGNKIITTGEGGIVLTNNEEYRDKIEELRDHGMSKHRRYHHVHLGFNYRMTNLQAAIGLAQLERLDDIIAMREKQEKEYERLMGSSELLQFRPKQSWCQTVHWMMTISLMNPELRDGLIAYLKTRNIDSRPMITPVHLAPPYRDENIGKSFPLAEAISSGALHLPSSTDLQFDEISFIAAEVLGWLEQHHKA
jgi:perosamine synthetase